MNDVRDEGARMLCDVKKRNGSLKQLNLRCEEERTDNEYIFIYGE